MSRARCSLCRLLPVVLLALLLLPSACVTCAMWEHLDQSRGQRVAAVLLTPVTATVDAALIAGYVCAQSCGCECRGAIRCR